MYLNSLKTRLHSIILFACCLFFSTNLFAQITIGFQGGEPGDTWGYTSTGASTIAISEATMNPNKVTGTTSLVVGGNTGGGSCFSGGSGNGPSTPRTFTFNALDITSSNGETRTLTFNWGNRFPNCNGPGWDNNENLVFRAYHDGIAQPQQILATGYSDASFSIQANQFTWSIPSCVTSFYFVLSVTTNRADELLFIDDVRVTTPQLTNPLLQPSAISGLTTICNGSTETYSVLAETGVTHTWSGLPVGASFESPNGTHSMTINWGTATPGTYTLSVSPLNSCGNTGMASQLQVVVDYVPAPVTISGPTTICPGEQITLISSSAIDNNWSTSETTPTIYVSTSGIYTVTVQTSCGMETTNHEVMSLTNVTATITLDGPSVLCAGDQRILSSGNTTGNLWSTGETTQSIAVDSPGTYTLTVTNTCGNDVASEQITLLNPPTALIIPGGSLELCPNQNVVLVASGGTNYLWSNGETTSQITVTNSGTYTVASSNQCGQITSSPIEVTQLSLPTPQIIGNTTICAGEQTQLTASGGDSYLWNGGQVTNIITVTTAGTYSVTAINQCGQVTSPPITVTVIQVPTAQITGSTLVCEGKTTILNGSGGSSQIWSTNEITPSIVVQSGSYVFVAVNECGTDTATITINSSIVNAEFSASPIEGIAPLLVDFINHSTNNISNDWDFDNGSYSNDTDPSTTFTTPGLYVTTLTVTNANGCTDSYPVSIQVNHPASFVNIPNVFTPNGDQLNDLFQIETHNLSVFELQILNRWGNLILTINDPLDGWDGTIGGTEATSGTYFYQLTATGIDNENYNKTGFFELIR